MKEIILTQAAPAPVGPYSQAVRAGGWLYVSGQVPIDPQTGSMVEPDIRLQTRRVLDNLAAVLEAGGAVLADVVKVTVFMTKLSQFSAMNEVFSEYFGDAPPARACIEAAALPKDSLVEIECIACVG
jgi:2-iminobutanoate/2-iminopropanoate deaminase